jgi:hypothetical protein
MAALFAPEPGLAAHIAFKGRPPRAARRRAVRWAPLLRGSHESLLRQNAEIDRLQLPRIADDAELEELIQREELVEIPETDSVRVAPNLQGSRRYCRPWTRDFVEDFSLAFYRAFRKPIQVNSAVRTVQQQKKLRRRNRNAAPAQGEIASSHLAGVTVDIAKTGMNRKQRKWTEQYFYRLQELGLIEAAEERRQPVFHVMVSDRYTEWREAQSLATR